MFFNFNLAKFITFQDKDICNRVRNIDKKNISEHDNKNLNIRIIENKQEFYSAFAMDIVKRIKAALEDNKMFIAILPVGPVPQYTIVAEMINKMKIPMHHVYTFNMDEYANEDGISAPLSWEGSFKRSMMDNFFNKIDDKLRPPLDHIHFPDSDNIDDYDKMVEDLGGADVCYGGIGWCGHIAFWESHLGLDFLDNIEEYKKQKSRIVELHPMTIMQNALHSFSGDWSNVP
ncbi:MAG: hypothetical protein PHW73_05200, partial [Atribacterota bacterium]|nr:hypothetical protein [Atribacterota bacterium]